MERVKIFGVARRRLKVRTGLVVLAGSAALVTSLLTAWSAAPVVAAPTPGQWTLRNGVTVNLSNMDINACNTNFAFLLVFDPNGNQVASPNLGNNSGSACSDTALSPFAYTNTSGQTETLKVRLDDSTCSASLYDSDGGGAANHATASHKAVSINDGGGSCANENVTSRPSLGQGNFNATVGFTHH
jgi:hypothetical protein